MRGALFLTILALAAPTPNQWESLEGIGRELISSVARFDMGLPADREILARIDSALVATAEAIQSRRSAGAVTDERLPEVCRTMRDFVPLLVAGGQASATSDSLMNRMRTLHEELTSATRTATPLYGQLERMLDVTRELYALSATNDSGRATSGDHAVQLQANGNSGVVAYAGPGASIQLALPTNNRSAKQDYDLAIQLAYGDGRRDPALALEHASAAADSGYAPALTLLGSWFYESDIVEPDAAEAYRLWRAAVDRGDAQGAYLMGMARLSDAANMDLSEYLDFLYSETDSSAAAMRGWIGLVHGVVEESERKVPTSVKQIDRAFGLDRRPATRSVDHDELRAAAIDGIRWMSVSSLMGSERGREELLSHVYRTSFLAAFLEAHPLNYAQLRRLGVASK